MRVLLRAKQHVVATALGGNGPSGVRFEKFASAVLRVHRPEVTLEGDAVQPGDDFRRADEILRCELIVASGHHDRDVAAERSR